MPIGVFATAIFISAFLLFWVQPLFSKIALPLLGGSPSVWNTAMMFFQFALLAGYGYVHLLTSRIRTLRWQFLIHGAVMAGGLMCLPIAISGSQAPPTNTSPIPWLIGLLASSVGWPFFALSATAPLLQSWFARSNHRLSKDPYFLYAASNFGSLFSLVAFPILLEPELTLVEQGNFWSIAYAALLLIVLALGIWLSTVNTGAGPDAVSQRSPDKRAADWAERGIWIALAFVPSSLLLGVTTYITTDIASAPLLWVVPLALYLMSFVIAFARRSLIKPEPLLKAQSIGILAVSSLVMLALIFNRGGSVFVMACIHLLAFFLTAIVCHSELARRRPGVDGLTAFYFCMSVGGAAGGVFNALIAPVIFSSNYEYYLALIAACGLRLFTGPTSKTFNTRDIVYPLALAIAVGAMAYHSAAAGQLGLVSRIAFLVPCALALYSFTERPFRFAAGIALVLGSAVLVQGAVDVLHTERSFFGINKVKLIEDESKIALVHGTTMHGTEFTDPELRREPLAYYARSGPVGQMLALSGLRPNVAAIGLGTGALACYRRPGEDWTFFEIDPAVERIARDARYFHYLAECGSGTKVIIGDGRLSLKAMPDHQYDLIVVDAFSSDSVPAHLLTKQAVVLYLQKVRKYGVVLFNVSNEYLSLVPVLTAVVDAIGVAARHQLYQPSPAEAALGASASEWMLVAATDADLDFLDREKRWQPISADRTAAPWTDDFSNIFRAIKW